MLTNEQESKLRALFDAGLVCGIGDVSKTCIEGALCLVLYGELSDDHRGDADCRGAGVVRASIRLNDARWSSNEARSRGLWDLALAQIGSASLDQRFIARRYAELTIRQVLPIALRAAGLLTEAERCERDGDEASARAAAAAYDAAAYDAAAYDAAAYDAAAAAARDNVLCLSACLLVHAITEARAQAA